MGWEDIGALMANGSGAGGFTPPGTWNQPSAMDPTGLGGLGSFMGQVGTYATGGYSPQAQLMGQLAGQSVNVPGWAKALGGLQSMGGISYSNGKGGGFQIGGAGGMGGGGAQNALLAALMSGKTGNMQPASGQQVTMRNESAVTDLAKTVQPIKYGDNQDYRGQLPQIPSPFGAGTMGL